MKNLRSGQNNIAGNHHKPGAGEWWFSFLVKVLNFLAWDVLNIMRKVEYEKLNRNRIDFENGIWYIRVKIQNSIEKGNNNLCCHKRVQ